ncbi:uncharacterized mitochondrial protein AtMg00810-like [Hevea brasiliensis]|uniref:uncharacterized mitochondrial protein AtMg00810-like n=1 Tax=Hevea brasiliensis TaxID=3981 RepID=UPI0025F0E7AF|nr:uncharacterized mitochondrial protein AtMg00810-like [Hevea brasiliensis]
MKSLYGLKQAGRQWNKELTAKLQSFGFHQSAFDHCLFTIGSGNDFLALLVYADDLLITGANEERIIAVKQFMDKQFTIKDLGYVKYFMGLEFARSEKGMFLNQRKCILDILQDAGLQNAKIATYPLPKGLKLGNEVGELLQNPDKYRWLVGRLLYLGLTRPDISYATQQQCQFMQAPRRTHWDAAILVLKYLKGCPSKSLFYPSNNDLKLRAFCDADWISCPISRKSITGFYIFLGPSLIS